VELKGQRIELIWARSVHGSSPVTRIDYKPSSGRMPQAKNNNQVRIVISPLLILAARLASSR
jgi:hypothetical protein